MLSDDDLIHALQAARRPEPAGADAVAERVIHRHRVRHRRVRAAQFGVPVAALLAAAVLVGLNLDPADRNRSAAEPTRSVAGSNATTTPSTSSSTGSSTDTSAAPAEVSLSLDGYRLSLPRTFSSGAADTNCTGQLRLATTERSRLIRTPDAGCPLLISSVRSVLPASAIKVTAQVPQPDDTYQSVRFYRVLDPVSRVLTGYLPVRLPGGGEVYVVLDARTPATSTQLLQLEQGLRVGVADAPGGS